LEGLSCNFVLFLLEGLSYTLRKAEESSDSAARKEKTFVTHTYPSGLKKTAMQEQFFRQACLQSLMLVAFTTL
jgi:hypothetical protein